jgi:hypothetical protein
VTGSSTTRTESWQKTTRQRRLAEGKQFGKIVLTP